MRKFWPTPKASDGEKGNRSLEGAKAEMARTGHPDLPAMVKLDDPPPPSTSSQGDFLASLSPSPGDAEARQMTAISGRRCIGSWTHSGPLGCLEKMLLGSFRWASTRCFLTWKPAATPQGRLLYRLRPSMPRIDESGSGLWATPAAYDATPGGPNNHYKGLGHAAKHLWPTPRAMEIPTGKNAQGGVGLTSAVQMWPTPTAGMAKTAGGCTQGYINRRRLEGKNDLAEAAVDGMVGNGSLNPTWVEWLMGYPLGWTDLEPSGMLSSRKSSPKSAEQS